MISDPARVLRIKLITVCQYSVVNGQLQRTTDYCLRRLELKVLGFESLAGE